MRHRFALINNVHEETQVTSELKSLHSLLLKA